MDKVQIFEGKYGADELSEQYNKWRKEKAGSINIFERKITVNANGLIILAIFYQDYMDDIDAVEG